LIFFKRFSISACDGVESVGMAGVGMGFFLVRMNEQFVLASLERIPFLELWDVILDFSSLSSF
jgi:hypothetical protein